LALDDAAGRVHDCDFLLDSASTDDRRYAGFVPDHARVLGGPLFALLRRNFLKHRDVSLARRDGRRVKQILLSFGAADPAKLVPVALDALKGLSDDVAVVVAMSSCAPHIEEVRRSTDCRSVQLVLDSQDISDVMVKSDIAIGAVGVTALERAALGLPSIHVGITENQRGVSELLRQAGASLDAGPVDAELGTRLKGHIDALLADPDRRIRMARAASELADGKGPLRVLIALAGDMGNGAPHVRLRLADGTDRDQLLHLQRQPGIRQHARNPAIPGPDEHARWMDRMLRDASTLLMIIEVGGRNAGMIRLDQKDPVDGWRRFEISIAIAPEFQGRGVARTVLSLARKMFPGAALDAEILPSNGASLKLFAQSGYARVSGNLYRNEAQGRRLD